jgi:hypothetical protein
MSAITSALLHLYPRGWRRRYGAEMRALLADQRISLRTIADLLAGAVDARLNPQRAAAVEPVAPRGVFQMTKATICNPAGVSTADAWRSAAWMIGGSLVFTALGILLKLQLGPNALSEALTLGAFFAALMLSMEPTYLKRYSRPARLTISIGGALFIIAIMWAATAIGNRI